MNNSNEEDRILNWKMVEMPEEIVRDALGEQIVLKGLVDSEMIDEVTYTADQRQTILSVPGRYDWKGVLGTLMLVVALLAIIAICFYCFQWVGSLNQLDGEETALIKLAISCTTAAIAGVIARWLTLAAKGIPGPFYNLAEYLRRWLADATSTGLIVTVIIMVARSVSIQMDTVTISLADASREMSMGLAFVFGFFARRARELLYGISRFTFLRRGENNRSEEQQKQSKKEK